MTGRVRFLTLCVAVVSMFALSARADVPRQIHYQGKLKTIAGQPVTSSITLRLRLYDHPTNPTPVLFDETQSSVAVANGLFSVLIGSQTAGGVPDSALDAAGVYLGVSIDGGPELLPRSPVASEAHAIKARSAEQLVTPGTFTPAVTIDANGKIQILNGAPGASKVLTAEDGTGRASWQDLPASGGPWTDDGTYIYANTTTVLKDVVVSDDGKIGVGTQSPSEGLQISKTGDAALRLENKGLSSTSTITFSYTGAAQQWQVPTGVTSIGIDVMGAQGGASGGQGGRVNGTITVTPGETLYLYVGGQPSPTSGQGGFNGGGNGGSYNNQSGGGGGASDIRRGGTNLNNRIVVAAGGGGGGVGGNGNYAGGNGGGLTGDQGIATWGSGGGGGTQSAGGTRGCDSGCSPTFYVGTVGSLGTGGNGGCCYYSAQGGGGGGGYYGGGGGGLVSNNVYAYGGGGGSSLAPAGTSTTSGYRAGHGQIIISYSGLSGGANWIIGGDQSDSGKFKISEAPGLGSADRLTITHDGKVGIGTSTPTSTLEVNGPTKLNGLATIPSISGTTAIYGSLQVFGSLSKTSGTFDIPYPDPALAKDGWHLRHSFVESPTRGDNLYRWEVQVTNGRAVVDLPDYFHLLNENPQVWVSPVEHFGRAYGKVDATLTRAVITADGDGLYNVLIVATRKDEYAKQGFDEKGVKYQQKPVEAAR